MWDPVQESEFDVRFSVWGIPVRVIPTFWLFAALLGWGYVQAGVPLLVTWVLVAFVSVLIHELGHATVASLFGYPPRIVLYHFGGAALFAPYGNFTAGKSVLITLAGPGAGMVLAGVAYGTLLAARERAVEFPPLVGEALVMLVFANLVWSLFNLLPVLPLDGGQICRDVCTSMSPRRGEAWAIRIAVMVSAGVAVWAVQRQSTYTAILFGMLCWQNVQALQSGRFR
jgi:Zn-dependent protease